MGLEPELFSGRPCDLPGCAASADPSVSFAHRFSNFTDNDEEVQVRAVALDVHRDFCEVAIGDERGVRAAGRIKTAPEELELFAQSLDVHDHVALEVTGNAWEIARILEPHVARVIVVSPSDTGIRQARAKTDRLDARALCELLWAGRLDSVWMPDERVRAMRRRLSRRTQLVRARTRAKNEIHAALMRCLKGKPPMSDLFGVKGRAWLCEQQLPVAEQETVDTALRQVDFLDSEIAAVERLIAAEALSWPEVKRLMTVPGVNVIVAATFMAAVGDISRFGDRRKLTGYLGLDPRVRQSGSGPANHGRISKQGSSSARHALVEASWSTVRQPGPIAGFYSRVKARRGHSIAIVASARKLACLFWCLLTRGEDYAFAQPSLTKKKMRRLELQAGAPRYQGGRSVWSTNDAMRKAERELALQAQRAYERTVRDWQQKKGASATPGRASRGSSKEQVARQTTRPKSAL
jgi:transposase